MSRQAEEAKKVDDDFRRNDEEDHAVLGVLLHLHLVPRVITAQRTQRRVLGQPLGNALRVEHVPAARDLADAGAVPRISDESSETDAAVGIARLRVDVHRNHLLEVQHGAARVKYSSRHGSDIEGIEYISY